MLDVTNERASETSADEAIDLGSERGPVRTCVGCRARDDKDALVRLAVVPEELRQGGPAVVPDVARRAPGRGVHVHPTRACVKAAVERGGIARAVKGAPGTTAAALTDAVVARLEARLDGLLAGARRARKLAIGGDATSEALASARAQLVLVAPDVGGRSAGLAERARATGVAVALFRDKARLGALVGGGRVYGRDDEAEAGQASREVGVVAVLDPGIAAEVVRTLGRVAQLDVAGALPGEVSEAR